MTLLAPFENISHVDPVREKGHSQFYSSAARLLALNKGFFPHVMPREKQLLYDERTNILL